MAKTYYPVQLSYFAEPAFREALALAAEVERVSASEFVRLAVQDRIYSVIGKEHVSERRRRKATA